MTMDKLAASAEGNLGIGLVAEYGYMKSDNSTPPPVVNDNSTVYYDEGGPEPMPIYARLIIIVMYSTVSVLSIGGNVIVCYIVVAYQRMRTVTNYFIVNLACSDILMSVLCIPLTFTANLLVEYWPFGHFMCPVVTYAQVVTVFLSAFTLVAISLDRFRAIICPLRPKLTTRQAVVVIALIWAFSLAVPLPVALFSRIIQRPDLHGEIRDYCQEDWPGGVHQRTIYTFGVMVLQYFLPLFVLAFTYTWIGVVIWVKKPPGEAQNSRDQRMAQSKRKMVKMMITVVIIYGLCWLPLHSITIIGDVNSDIWSFKYIQTLWIACHWLAMSNCCYNPMVYCWMNTRFRNGFSYVFRYLRLCMCCCCCNNKQRLTTRASALGNGRHNDDGATFVSTSKRNYTCVYTMKDNTRTGMGGGGGTLGTDNMRNRNNHVYRPFTPGRGVITAAAHDIQSSSHSSSSQDTLPEKITSSVGMATVVNGNYKKNFKTMHIAEGYQAV